MDTKISPVTALSFFKETRIGNEHISESKTIQLEVHTPSNTSALNTFNHNPRPRRRVLNKRPTFKNDEDYSKNLLANSGSIYFGTAKRYPRSIVWRILLDRKVLELRSADLCKDEEEKREATINIQLFFSSPIKNGGVSLVDAEDSGCLNLFVLTKESELLTFTIRREFFCDESASEEDINKWYKVFKPVSFAISAPHHLIATNSLQVVVSLSDGRLLSLTRKSGDDGSVWHEAAYGDGQWATFLGGLVPWQGSNTTKYDGTSLDSETATGLALSPDRRHAYAVCLNHTLKAWSLDTAKSVFSMDLLGQPRDIHELPKVMLDPGALHRVRVFQAESMLNGDEYYVMTFSPHDLGQFKIWGIRDPSQASRGIRDMFPEYVLQPPDPDPSLESKAIWKVADFTVNSARKGDEMEIWILMRSNRLYRLYNLTFRLEEIGHQWRNNWLMTTLEMPDQYSPPSISDSDPEDITDLWLDLLFYPGRYPESVLETALAIYSSAREVDTPSDLRIAYQERLWSAITSQVQRKPAEDGGIDFQTYRNDINQEWTLLWQDVRDLNNSRWDILALAFDEISNMPWIIFADGYSAIRRCSKLEMIAHNTHEELASTRLLETPSIEVDSQIGEPNPSELAVYISTAATFRQSFAYPSRQMNNRFLSSELWQQPLLSIPTRMQSFYENFNFEDEIGDVEIDDLESGLEAIGGYEGLDTNSFLAIIDELPKIMQTEVSGLVSTQFGRRALVEGAQQMIGLYERILLDLLVIVVFINAEVDREEKAFENFNGSRLYVALLDQLRKYQMMQWLAKNVRHSTNALSEDSDMGGSGSREAPAPIQGGISTVLEDLFVMDVKPQEFSEQSQSEALTKSIQDILQWVTGGNDSTITLDVVLVHVQCNLLANNNLDLALDFLCYQPSTAWATYIKGRLYLARFELATANIYFKKAAFKLSRPVPSFDYHSASHNFLSSLEAAHFGKGLDSYYTHILNLFEAAESPSYAASYANLALLFTSSTNDDQTITLLNSAFRASLSISNFDSAYTALTKHPDPTTLLPSLIDAMIAHDEADRLITYPFPAPHHPTIESILHHKARSAPLGSPSAPRLYEILSAWRLGRNNPRGAAAALLERLDRLQLARRRGSTTKPTRRDEDAARGYLCVINLLSLAKEKWVLVGGGEEGGAGTGTGTGTGEKRRVVTIEEVRRRYQELLDEMSAVELGRFDFGLGKDGGGGGERMDIL